MKPSYVLFFLCGAAVMLAFSALRRPHRRDLQTAQHEEYRLLVARRCAGFSEPVHLHSGASQSAGSGEKLGCFPSRSGMAEGEGGIGDERTIGRSYRSLLHGSDQLFSPQLVASKRERTWSQLNLLVRPSRLCESFLPRARRHRHRPFLRALARRLSIWPAFFPPFLVFA